MPWEPPVERYLEVRGIRMRVYDSADLRGYDSPTALVMLHGMPGQLTNWRYQIECLQPHWRVIAPDMRGYGRSDKPREVTFEDYLLDLEALLEELGLDEEDAVLVGHSFGAMVAQVYAADRDLRGLVLLGSALRHRGGAAEWAMRHLPAAVWKPLLFKPSPLTVRMYRKMFCSPSSSREAFERFMEDNADYIAGLPAHVHRYELALEGYDASEFLPRIRCPTLVMVGEDDGVTPPEDSRVIAEAVQDAKLVILRSAGHLAMYERPEEVCERIREFLLGLGAV